MATIKFKNLDSFYLDLRKFSDLTETQHVQLLKKVALELLTRIVEKTPVDTGRARGNWQVAVNTGAGSADISRIDKSGEAEASLSQGTSVSIDAGYSALADLKPFSTIVIFNNVEYIVALEHGHSQRQAPQGMVALSIAEVESQFR